MQSHREPKWKSAEEAIRIPVFVWLSPKSRGEEKKLSEKVIAGAKKAFRGALGEGKSFTYALKQNNLIENYWLLISCCGNEPLIALESRA